MNRRQKFKLIQKYGHYWICSGRKPWKKKHKMPTMDKLVPWATEKMFNGWGECEPYTLGAQWQPMTWDIIKKYIESPRVMWGDCVVVEDERRRRHKHFIKSQ